MKLGDAFVAGGREEYPSYTSPAAWGADFGRAGL
jgi:hypothetical protein